MGRQRIFRKMKMPPLLENAAAMVVSKGAVVAVAVIVLVAAGALAKAFLYRSDYFRVRTVDIRAASLEPKIAAVVENQMGALYRGRNIFRVDLREVSGYTQKVFPDAKEIVARVTLPDRLTVLMKFRKPVALVRGARVYAVDDDGVILSNPDPRVLKGLPFIDGVTIWTATRKGKGEIAPNLRLALDLLREARRCRIVAEYGIVSVNARSLRDLSFVLSCGIEVRIGYENYRERLQVFEKTLRAKRLAPDKVRYVDLRFGEVSIGTREGA